jgi:hypothetical protein
LRRRAQENQVISWDRLSSLSDVLRHEGRSPEGSGLRPNQLKTILLSS